MSSTSWDDLVKNFLSKYPLGFNDPAYIEEERIYKDKQSALLQELLPREEFELLLSCGEVNECLDRIIRTVTATNLVHQRYTQHQFCSNLVKHHELAVLLPSSLFKLLYEPGTISQAFNSFSGLLEDIHSCSWQLSTLFLALLDPTKHLFVQPARVKTASQLFCPGPGLRYSPEPTHDGYMRIVKFAEHAKAWLLRQRNPNLHPADLWDMQGFMFVSIDGDAC